MSISSISMPSWASCLFSRLQNAHHGVVYMVSGSAIFRQLPSCSLLPNAVTPYPAAGFPHVSAPCGRMSGTRRCAAMSPDGPTLTGPDAVLASLDPEQRAVALASRGPVCVLAGAGTGKTRAVVHRIAYAVATGVADPGRVLAVTFTTRAAGELRGRLRQLGAVTVPGAGMERVQALTFHAAALRQLNHFWPSIVGGQPPQVLDSKISLVAEVARRLRLSAALSELRDAAAEIEWAKVSQVRPDDYVRASAKSGRTGPFTPVTLTRLYAGYEELRRERHLVDFESVLELAAAMLDENPVAAAQVRSRYSYFVVDEYQDVNPLQKLLLDVWLGGSEEVCVVGDPRQTIYSFTGATSAFLTGFAAEIAVLLRTNAQTPAYEQALTAAGVPFQVRGAERFFSRAEVRQAVALLRAAAKSASAQDDPPGQVRPILAGAGLTSEGPAGRGQARERWESLEALAQLADDFFARAPGATLADLAAELAHRSAIGQAPALDGVTLGSLHAAKGLEWDAVFLPGLTDGTLPIIYAKTDEAIEEERRLFYVGVTRARLRALDR